MPPVNYWVRQPGVVTEAFRRLLDQATAEGRLAVALRAARYVMDELSYAPARLGESRERIDRYEIEIRFAVVRPWRVEFSVHEPTRQVFIRRIGLGE